mgnify:CR=1 FL=1
MTHLCLTCRKAEDCPVFEQLGIHEKEIEDETMTLGILPSCCPVICCVVTECYSM